jgi:hypothetical protein
MKTEENYYAAKQAADDIHYYLSRVGVACYQTPSCNRVLWIPWWKNAINLNEPKAVGHALVMTGYMAPNISMRATVVDEFISICRRTAQAIKNAPKEAQIRVREMHLQ